MKYLPLLYILVTFTLTGVIAQECATYNSGNAFTEGTIEPAAGPYPDGSAVTVTCTADYVVEETGQVQNKSSLVSTCTAGVWDVEYTRCVICNTDADCGNAVCVPATKMCYCNEGYELAEGNRRYCAEIMCDKLDIHNAAVSPDQDAYAGGETVAVTCTGDYEISGEVGVKSKSLSCGDGGETARGDWDPNPADVTCVVCNSDAKCTNGKCQSNQCQCNTGYEPDGGSTTVCKEIVCTDAYCTNKDMGTCVIDDNKRKCDCIDGVTTGDRCDTFVVEPCKDNPCQNGGTCERGAAPDFNTAKCECATPDYSGDTCQFVDNFYHSGDSVAVITEDTTRLILEFTPAKTTTNMVIAIIQFENEDNEKVKLVVYYSPKCIGFQWADAAPVEKCNSDFYWQHGKNKLELYRSSLGTIGVKVNDKVKLKETWREVYLPMLNIDPKLSYFKKLIIGGCKFDDVTAACMSEGLTPKVFYNQFIGTMHKIQVKSGDVWDTVEWSALKGQVELGARNCDNYLCNGRGVCKMSTSDEVYCECADHYSGLACDLMAAVSFNGYTSQINSSVEIPLMLNNSLAFDLKKKAGEKGTLGTFTLGDCKLRLDVDGITYKLSTAAVGGIVDIVGDDVTINLHFVNGEARLRGVAVDCPIGTPDTPTFSAEFGTRLEEGKTLQERSLAGCIQGVTINNRPLLQAAGVTQQNIDMTQCVITNTPENPCVADTPICLNEMECTINPDDYSSLCDCKPPYIHGEKCDRKDYCADKLCTAENTLKCNNLTVDPFYGCECKPGFLGQKCETENPHCTKPTISSGSVSPSSAKIYGGESYTVTCNTDYYLVGEATLNCTVANGKATLTASPTCAQEKVEPVTDKDNSTTIIVVVVICAVVIGIVVVVLLVRRKRGRSPQQPSDKSKGQYSPQNAEIEMGGSKTNSPPTKSDHLYTDVIENINIESNNEETAKSDISYPPPPPDTDIYELEPGPSDHGNGSVALAPASAPASAPPPQPTAIAIDLDTPNDSHIV